MGDISTRVDEFKQRLDILGRGRSTVVWSVPQAFGNEMYDDGSFIDPFSCLLHVSFQLLASVPHRTRMACRKRAQC